MKTSMRKALALLTAVLTLPPWAAGCSRPVPDYPVASTPEETAAADAPELTVRNETVKLNKADGNAYSDPNALLRDVSLDVYFDNTQGCFYGYSLLPREETCFKVFSMSMAAYREALGSGRDYTAYTLSPSEGRFRWTANNDFFSTFNLASSYTVGENAAASFDDAPIVLWADTVAQGVPEHTITVYTSDLNEQKGMLPDAGTKLSEVMRSHEELDLMILSYELPYIGVIYAPTLLGDGNGDDGIMDRTFSTAVDRCYYTLAVGPRDALMAFSEVLQSRLEDIGIASERFMYRDMFYQETEYAARDPRGETIGSASYIEEHPPAFTLLGKNGEPFDPGEAAAEAEVPAATAEVQDDPEDVFANAAADDDVFGGGRPEDHTAGNPLERFTDTAPYFIRTADPDAYYFRSLNVEMGTREAEVSFRLENSTLYTLSADAMKLYLYTYQGQGPQGGGADANDDLFAMKVHAANSPAAASGWSWTPVEADSPELREAGITVDCTDDLLTVRLSRRLSAKDNLSPFLAVSVPVSFTYAQSEETYDVKLVTQGLKDYVTAHTAPNTSVEDWDSDAWYTRTYLFDRFFDQLVGLKAAEAADSGERSPVEGSADTAYTTVTADTLNAVIVADEVRHLN